MKVKLLRTLGTALVAELGEKAIKCPTEDAVEGAEVDVTEDCAKELFARSLAEPVGKHEAAPKHEAPKAAPKTESGK